MRLRLQARLPTHTEGLVILLIQIGLKTLYRLSTALRVGRQRPLTREDFQGIYVRAKLFVKDI
jgi:hypothetical protein